MVIVIRWERKPVFRRAKTMLVSWDSSVVVGLEEQEEEISEPKVTPAHREGRDVE